MQVYARCGALFQTRGGKEGVEVAGKAGRSIEASPEGEGIPVEPKKRKLFCFPATRVARRFVKFGGYRGWRSY